MNLFPKLLNIVRKTDIFRTRKVLPIITDLKIPCSPPQADRECARYCGSGRNLQWVPLKCDTPSESRLTNRQRWQELAFWCGENWKIGLVRYDSLELHVISILLSQIDSRHNP